MLAKTWFLALALSACGKPDKPPTESTPNESVVKTYDDAATRLLAMTDSGWVVSRWSNTGAMRDQGDSLIFTGIAMGALPCAEGEKPEAALLQMLHDKNGGVYRHPSIPNEYSLDGLLGLWWGIDQRTKHCPESRQRWAEILPAHAKAVSIEPFFHTVLDQVGANLGVHAAPTPTERGELGTEMAAWAIAVVSHKAAAYRLHLALLTLSVVDAPKGKVGFCEAVKDAKIALLEHFCDRPGLEAWTGDFVYNRWVYHFQRGAWETPDGVDGLETPGLDLIMALSVLYPKMVFPTKI